MGKYTKKRNCRKNKSMKKGGQYPDDVKNDEGRPAGPVDSTGSTSDSTTGETGAPSGSTSGEPKPSFWSSLTSMFSSKKPDSTTGGRKNKQRKSKSKSKK